MPRRVTMTITVPEGLQEKVDAVAGERGRSRWIREAIDEKLQRDGLEARVRLLERKLGEGDE